MTMTSRLQQQLLHTTLALSLLVVFCCLLTVTNAVESSSSYISEVSWSFRQLINNTRHGDKSELAVLILPCRELTSGEHLLKFLLRMLGRANVDYDKTRVSLWVGQHVVEDQIRYPAASKTFCTLKDNLMSALDNTRYIRPDFNASNILTAIENVLFQSNRPVNGANKHALIIHCGLQLNLPFKLNLLERSGSMLTLAHHTGSSDVQSERTGLRVTGYQTQDVSMARLPRPHLIPPDSPRYPPQRDRNDRVRGRPSIPPNYGNRRDRYSGRTPDQADGVQRTPSRYPSRIPIHEDPSSYNRQTDAESSRLPHPSSQRFDRTDNRRYLADARNRYPTRVNNGGQGQVDTAQDDESPGGSGRRHTTKRQRHTGVDRLSLNADQPLVSPNRRQQSDMEDDSPPSVHSPRNNELSGRPQNVPYQESRLLTSDQRGPAMFNRNMIQQGERNLPPEGVNRYNLQYVRLLDVISSKAFLADTSELSYSKSDCYCRDDSAICMCNRLSGDNHCLCPPGHHRDSLSGLCTTCPANSYSSKYNVKDKELACKPCADVNHISPEGSVSHTDCVCKEGYTASANGSHCSLIVCPRLLPPAHGFFVSDTCDNVVNAACGVRCEPGYELIGGSVRMCQGTGVWSGTEPHCRLRRCEELRAPRHGTMSCSTTDLTYGTRCKFACSTGYKLLGPVKRSCLSVGQWSGIETSCQDVKCPALPKVLNGYINPPNCTQLDQDYGITCQLTCRTGYTLVGPVYKQCTNTGRWQMGSLDWMCVDNEPPDIQCPDDITIAADPRHYLTTVPNIRPPRVRDRSAILSISRMPAQLVSNFPLGSHAITYRVEDVWNNVAQCDFKVLVYDASPPIIESCLPPQPVIANFYAKINTSQPVFSDNSVLHLADSTTDSKLHPSNFDVSKRLTITSTDNWRFVWPYGVTSVSYTAVDASGNNSTCDFNVTVLDIHVLCQESSNLVNSVLVCNETSADTATCVTQCKAGYWPVLELQPANITCDTGVVSPAYIPDCSKYTPATFHQLLTSSVKVTPSCTDQQELSSIITAIEDQFFIQMNLLCSDFVLCNSSLRLYQCQPSVQSSIVTVEFNVTITTSVEDRNESPRILTDAVQFLEAFLSDGLFMGFDLPQQLVQDLSFDVIKKDSVCKRGQVQIDLNCYDCPRGSRLDTANKQCIVCPIGTYQDSEGESICKPCSQTSTTLVEGSKSAEQCLEFCREGFYSATGLDDPRDPCRSCDYGTYQPRVGQKNCISCYTDHSTLHRGATTAAQCKGLAPCVPCPRHSYQPDAHRTYCMLCPGGRYTANPGANSQSQCLFDNDDGNSVRIRSDVKLQHSTVIMYSECFHYPCLQNSTCHSLPLGFYCECQKGFTGTFCEIEVNECHSAPCLNDAQCIDIINDFRCICPLGWTGRRCEVEVVECSSAPCQHDGSCIDRLDGYECLCKAGFNGTNCEVDIDECFSQPCEHNSTCIDLPGKFTCDCLPGYKGRLCETEINECEEYPCMNRGSCVNTPGSFRCECSSGYEGSLCELNIDECLSSPCMNSAACQDQDNDFLCICRPGYGGRLCDRVMTSDYVLHFNGEDNSYSSAILPEMVLHSISVSFWIRTADQSHLGTPFSYANHQFANAFTLTDTTGLVLYVNNEPRSMGLFINDGQWHFVAATWSNVVGSWQLYIDGVVVDEGSGLRLGDLIQGGGRFLLGQDQDNLGDEFNELESLVGEVTFLNVWDHVLQPHDILAMYTFCDDYADTVLSWSEFRFNLIGPILITNSSFCSACARPEDIPNGEVVWSDTLTAGIALYTCNTGYQLSGVSRRSCMVTGLWSDTAPSCHIIDCGDPPSIADVDLQLVSGTEYTHAAVYNCPLGYTGSGRLTCDADGSWSGTMPSCTKLYCPDVSVEVPLYIANFSSECKENSSTGAITCPSAGRLMFSCLIGYQLIGQSWLECDMSGRWLTQVSACEPISSCQHPPPVIEGAVYKTSNVTGTLIASYLCLPGWNVLGNTSLPCIGSDWLEPNFICTRTTCPPPVITNGIVITDTEYSVHQYEDVINVTCLSGYELVGEMRLLCTENGTWSTSIPHCQPVVCPPLEPVEFGDYSVSNESLVYGTKATYQCHIGYTLIGEGHLLCTSSAVWSSEEPVCDPVTCNTPPNLPHSSVEYLTKSYNSTATYRCLAGYSMSSGDGVIRCEESGLWSAVLFSCELIMCGQPSTIPNSFLQVSNTSYAGVASHTCLEGYTIQGVEIKQEKINQYQTCSEAGLWYPTHLKDCVKVECPPILDLEHGEIIGDDFTYESIVQFTCDEGYKLTSARQVLCLPRGVWSAPIPSCDIISCELPSTPENGGVSWSSLQYNSSLSYHCDKGFAIAGSTEAICDETGFWSGSTPTCQLVSCPKPPVLMFGNISASCHHYNCSVMFTCDTGYYIVGVDAVTCLANGTWSHSFPYCKQVTCDPLPMYVEHGIIEHNNSITVGSTVTIQCDNGHKTMLSQQVCSTLGLWVDNSTYRTFNLTENVCQPVVCKLPTADDYTLIHMKDNTTEYLSAVSYDCVKGYRLVGPTIRECMADTQWSGLDSYCELITCPPILESSHLNFNVSNEYLVLNTTVMFSCDDGYTLNGSHTAQCTDVSAWSHPPPVCVRIVCDEVDDIENGRVIYQSLIYASNVTYECNEGYLLVGVTHRTCHKRGMWTGYAPHCVARECSLPSNFTHGTVTFESLTTGSSVEFHCLHGYELIGASSAYCMTDGSWNSSIPTCDLVTCPEAVAPSYGQVTGNHTYGSVVTYSCQPEYQLRGHERNYCRANGTWLYDSPADCVMKTCSLPPVVDMGYWRQAGQNTVSLVERPPVHTELFLECQEGYEIVEPEFLNTTIRCDLDMIWQGLDTLQRAAPVVCQPVHCPSISVMHGFVDGTDTQYMSSIRIRCMPGYHLHDNSSVTLKCSAEGEWWPPVPQCTPILCDKPEAIENGIVLYDHLIYNSTAEYSCYEGFRLVGHNKSVCSETGSWLNIQPPMCVKVTCKHPGILEHGQIYGRFAEEMDVGERLVVVCEIGYELNGAIVSRCMEDGQWSYGLPRCSPISCPPLTSIPNGRLILEVPHYKSVAKYECEPGYELHGFSERMCLLSKNWNGQTPECVPMPCPPPPQLPHSIVVNTSHTFYPGQAVLYGCSTGYVIRGNASIVCDADRRWPLDLPVCSRICLNPFVSIKHAQLTTVKVIYADGDVVKVTCENGYHTEGNDILVCQSDGSWKSFPSQPRCVPTVCELPAIAHLKYTGSVSYNSTVTYLCEEGYRLVGNDTSVCLSDGGWSHPYPECLRVDCGHPKAIPNGVMQYTSTEYLAVAEYSCNVGYQLLNYSTVTCEHNSSWSPNPPICQPVMCPDDVVVRNGQTISNSSTYLSEMVLSCNLGYELRGNNWSQCSEHQLWIPLLGSCDPIKCSSPPHIHHLVLVSSSDIVYFYNDSISYRCDDGFDPQGVKFMAVCTLAGDWDFSWTMTPCTRQTCTLPYHLPHMGMQLQTDADGFTVTFSCSDGYQLIGSEIVHCVGSVWDDSLPHCELRLCQTTQPLSFAFSSYVVFPVTSNVSIAEYSCQQGYVLEGNPTSYCEQHTGWNTTKFTCRPITCPHIQEGGHLLMSYSDDARYYNSSVVFSCEPGFELSGDAEALCSADGSWSVFNVSCSRKLCKSDASSPQHGFVLYSSYAQASTAEIRCDNGYKLIGDSVITCGEDGSWTNHSSLCVAHMCQELSPTLSMTVQYSTDAAASKKFPVNTTASIGCIRGYTLSGGDNFLTCDANGVWIPEPPACKPAVICKQPPQPEHTDLLPLATHYPGDVLNFTCSEGFLGHRILYCLKDGSWGQSGQPCKRVSCGKPSVRALASIHGTDYAYQRYVAVTCPPGYSRTGPGFIVCESNGMWSDIPRCVAET